MAAQIIDGKAIAAKIRAEIAEEVSALKAEGIAPCLAVIVVGADPASMSYVRAKRAALGEAGMIDRTIMLEERTAEAELCALIQKLNADDSVHGILVQLPLPAHIKKERALLAIDPKKDVDGFHPLNVGNFAIGKKAFVPCTAEGIVTLLRRSGIQTAGRQAVIVGRSDIVGKPSALLLLQREWDATVTVCHSKTDDLARFTRQADILIAAAGRPGMIAGDMVKAGAAVIDVGVNRIPDETKKSGFRLTGDVDFESARERAAFITPVPGGVGLLTIATLMANTVQAAKMRVEK